MAKKIQNKKVCNKPIGSAASEMLSLEPRIMLDAAALATGAEMVVDATPTVADTTGIQLPENMEVKADIRDDAKNQQSVDKDEKQTIETQPLGVDTSENGDVELVIVDKSIANYESLIAGLVNKDDASLAQDRMIEIIEIQPDADGILQITNALSNYDNVSAVHILSHADQGQLYLGNSVLSQDNLADYSDVFSGWSSHLTDGADLLLYGCDVAQGESGIQFVNEIGDLTGADVAASTDLTGNDQQNANWQLEYQYGAIQAASPFAATTVENFQGTLNATLDVTKESDVDTAFPGEVINYTIIVSNNGVDEAIDVTLQDLLDPNVTYNQDITITSISFNDVYTAVGNTELYVDGSATPTDPAAVVDSTLLDNDVGILGVGARFSEINGVAVGVGFTSTTFNTANATVTVNENGTMLYTPNRGVTDVIDSFQYTSTNTAGTTSIDATVTISIGDIVWYASNDFDPTQGDGTSTNPYHTLNSLTDGSADSDNPGDIIYNTTSSIAQNVTQIILEDNQQFIGTGVDLVVEGYTLAQANFATIISDVISPNNVSFDLANNNTLAGIQVNLVDDTFISESNITDLTLRDLGVQAISASAPVIELINVNGSILFDNVQITGTLFSGDPFVDIDLSSLTDTDITISNSVFQHTDIDVGILSTLDYNIYDTQFNGALAINSGTSGTVQGTLQYNAFIAEVMLGASGFLSSNHTTLVSNNSFFGELTLDVASSTEAGTMNATVISNSFFNEINVNVGSLSSNSNLQIGLGTNVSDPVERNAFVTNNGIVFNVDTVSSAANALSVAGGAGLGSTDAAVIAQSIANRNDNLLAANVSVNADYLATDGNPALPQFPNYLLPTTPTSNDLSYTITLQDAQDILDAAKILWEQAGYSGLENLTIDFRENSNPANDVGGFTNGLTDLIGDTIIVYNASTEPGWYVDFTPLDNSEFNTMVSDTEYRDLNTGSDRVDLLTAISHQVGAYLGVNLVPNDSLDQGTRYLPDIPGPTIVTDNSSVANGIDVDISNIDSAESYLVTFSVTVNNDFVIDQQTFVNNQALVNGVDAGDMSAIGDQSSVVSVEILPPLAVTKSADIGTAALGDVITYTITIQNDSNTTVTGVQITDVLDPTNALEFIDDSALNTTYTLASGEMISVDYTAQLIDPVLAFVESVSNTAIVNSNEFAGSQTNVVSVIVDADPNITISKSADVTIIDPDDTVNYTLTVTNEGDQQGVDITVLDNLDPAVFTSGSVMTTIASLLPGESTDILVSGLLYKFGVLPGDVTQTSNIASVAPGSNSNITNANSNEVTVDVNNVQPLAVVKTADVASARVNDVITYTISITNDSLKTITGIEVTDVLDPINALQIIDDSQLNTTYTLVSGGSVNLQYTAQVLDPVLAFVEDVSNIATVDSDQHDPFQTNEVTVLIDADPTLSLLKTADKSVVDANTDVTYTLTLTNTGDQEAVNIVLSDVLDPTVFATGSFSEMISSLLPGQSYQASFTGTVLDYGELAPTTISVSNTALAAAGDNSNIVDTQSNTLITAINQTANLTVLKEVDLPFAESGQTLEYTITITNESPFVASNVDVTDILGDFLTNPSVSLPNLASDVDIASQGSLMFNFTADVSQSVPDGQNYVQNSVTVSGDNVTTTTVTARTSLAGDINVIKTVDVDVTQPGDTVTYTIYVQNLSGELLTNAQLIDAFADELIPLEAVISPVNFGDNFSTVGNTELQVSTDSVFVDRPSAKVTGSLFDNDTAFWDAAPTLISFTSTSSNGGIVNVDSDGSFTYTPSQGFNGVDTFSYTAVSPGSNIQYVGEVSISVNDIVWYVDDNGTALGDGTSTNPFQTLAPLSGVGGIDGANQTIYLLDGTYTDSIILDSGQQLLGEAETLMVGGFLLNQGDQTKTPVLNSNDNAITSTFDNTIKGITVASTAGYGITAANAGTLNIDNVTINGAGAIINVSSTNLQANFLSLESTGGASNDVISLNNLTSGSVLETPSTSIASPTAASESILIINNNGSSFDFGDTMVTGGLSSSNYAVDLQNNTNSLISFDSLIIDVDNQAGLRGLNGGTLNVNDPAEVSSGGSQSGVLLNNINGTTNSLPGFIFKSISYDGSGFAGIELRNLSDSFTLIGDGSNAGTGGVINLDSGTAFVGVEVVNAIDVSLNYLNISSNDGFDTGIRVQNLDGLTVTHSTITGTGNGIFAYGAMKGTYDIINNNFNNIGSDAIQFVPQDQGTPAQSVVTININENVVSGANRGFLINTQNFNSFFSPSSVQFQIADNVLTGITEKGIWIYNLDSGPTFNGTINDNMIEAAFNAIVIGPQSSGPSFFTLDGFYTIAIQNNILNSAFTPLLVEVDFTGTTDLRITENTFSSTISGIFINEIGGVGINNHRIDILENDFASALFTATLSTQNPSGITVSYIDNIGFGVPALGNATVSATPVAALPTYPPGFNYSPLTAVNGENTIGAADIITLDQVNSLVQTAKTLWGNSTVSAERLAQLDNLQFVIDDLPDGVLGAHDGNTIYIDHNAANYGWFVDATPLDASEFVNPIAQIDLLTVIMHEMGHVLDFQDVEYNPNAVTIMSDALDVGQRYLPPQNGIVPVVVEAPQLANTVLPVTQNNMAQQSITYDLTGQDPVTLDLGDINNFDFYQIVIEAKVIDVVPAGQDGEVVTNYATLVSDQDMVGINTNVVSTTIDAEPILVLNKIPNFDAFLPGDTITYTLKAENIGNQNAVLFTLTDVIPDNTTYNAQASDPNWVVNPDGTFTIEFTPLNVGQPFSAEIAFDIPVNFPVDVAGVVNTATLVGVGAPYNFDQVTVDGTSATSFVRVIIGSGVVWTYDMQYYYDLGRYEPLELRNYVPNEQIISINTMDAFVNLTGSRNPEFYDPVFGPVDFIGERMSLGNVAQWPAIEQLLLFDYDKSFYHFESANDAQSASDEAMIPGHQQSELGDNDYQTFSQQLETVGSQFEQRTTAFAKAVVEL